jgi:hypothetical protein
MRWPITQREIEEQQARQRAEEQREAGGCASPSTSVMTPSVSNGSDGKMRRRSCRSWPCVPAAWAETVTDTGD